MSYAPHNTYKVLDIGVAAPIQESLDCIKMTRACSEMENCLAILKWRDDDDTSLMVI